MAITFVLLPTPLSAPSLLVTTAAGVVVGLDAAASDTSVAVVAAVVAVVGVDADGEGGTAAGAADRPESATGECTTSGF